MSFTLKILKLVTQYRFHPNLLFYDEKTKIGIKIFEQLKFRNWETEGLKLRFTGFAKEKRQEISIEHNQISLVHDNIDSTGKFASDFEQALKTYKSNVPIEKYRRLGTRSQSIFPVEFKFEELANLVHEKLFAQGKVISEIGGDKLIDLQYHVITQKDGFRIRIICGPVRKEEMGKWISPINLILSTGEDPEPNKYPNVGFFCDCDVSVSNPTSQDIDNFLTKSLEQAIWIPQKLGEFVLGE